MQCNQLQPVDLFSVLLTLPAWGRAEGPSSRSSTLLQSCFFKKTKFFITFFIFRIDHRCHLKGKQDKINTYSCTAFLAHMLQTDVWNLRIPLFNGSNHFARCAKYCRLWQLNRRYYCKLRLLLWYQSFLVDFYFPPVVKNPHHIISNFSGQPTLNPLLSAHGR